MSFSATRHEQLVLSPRAFVRVIADHERYVRQEGGGSRAFLRFADLSERDLTGRLLDEIDCTGADLSRSILRRASAVRGAFYGADLTAADLTDMIATRADFRGARLSGARLNNAVLDEADLRKAILAVAGDAWRIVRPGDTGASLVAANLEEADAGRVDFSNCSLKSARLRGSNLKGAIFTGAVMSGADLKGAVLSDAVFHNAVLTGIDLAELRIPADALIGCVVDPSAAAMARRDDLLEALEQAELWAKSGGRRGKPADLDHMDLRVLGNAFENRTLPALSARGAMAVGVSFAGCELQGANFQGADLRDATFSGTDLRGAVFRDARLAFSVFADADISPLPLSGGAVKATDFKGCNMAGVTLPVQHRPL
ncbi:pentapeptide repeat-containing protein [Rhizobium sp. CRIBSB]|nr:pentapeptide repeat-containing protein [Rhizobium sp. CRIBSB]